MGSLLRHKRTSDLRNHQNRLTQDHMQEKNLVYVTENKSTDCNLQLANWLFFVPGFTSSNKVELSCKLLQTTTIARRPQSRKTETSPKVARRVWNINP